MIPENETDCYTLQRNPVGPDYFFMGFFCYIPLPYICKYELPSVPENFTFNVQDISTNEAAFSWSSLTSWLNSSFQLSVKYYFEHSVQYIETFTLNTTHTKIVRLCPGHFYKFLLSARSTEGSQISLHAAIMVETRPLHVPSVKATQVTASELVLQWDFPTSSCNASFHHYLASILDSKTSTWETIRFGKSNTSAVIANIKSYHQYQIHLQSVSEKGALSCYEDPMLIITGVSPPTHVFILPEDIGEEHVIIYWKLPQEGQESYIQARPVAVMDKNITFLVNNTDSFKIEPLIPGMTYEIGVATVTNGNRSALNTVQCTLKPKPVKTVIPYEVHTTFVILFVQMPAVGITDGIRVMSKGDFDASFPLLIDGKVVVEDLIPGTEYDFFISTTSGYMLSSDYHLPAIRTCLAPPLNVREGRVTDTSIEILWDQADGNFELYEVKCVNCAGTFTVQKLTKEVAEFSNLIPGLQYNFTIKTEKEGYKDSLPVSIQVETEPLGICGLTSTVVNTSSTTFTWNLSNTNFTHYKASVSNNTFTKEYTVLRTQRHFTITDLTPGGIYNFTIQRVKDTTESVIVSIEVITEPEKVQKLKVFNVSSHSFSLRWRLPPGYVEKFYVHLVPSHGFVSLQDVGSGEYQADISSTTPGTTYNVTVSAVTSSVYSSPVSKTVTTNVTNPGPPVFLAGERVGSAGILLSWNTPPHPNGRILSYIVKYKEVCPWMQNTYTQVTTKPDSLEVLLTNLNPGTTYEIQVAAVNSAGIGIFSDPFLFQTAESAPGKVVNLTVEAFNYSAVNLIWFLPQQPNGKITSFKISVKHARSGIVVKDVTVKVEDLLSGRLPECNDNSESFLWSTTTPSTTSSKTTVFIPSTIAPSKMTSVWNEPISFVVTNLRPYTTYLFEVSASTIEAGYIDSAIVRTPESVPEDPPQNFVKSNVTGKLFSVSWEPPTIVTGKFSYRLELYGPSGHILENTTKDLKFTFRNLIPFTTYDVFVAAETSAGVGPKTNLTVFTPAGVPGPVFDLHVAEEAATFIRIAWMKPQEPNGIITQYRVQVLLEDTGETLEDTILAEKNTYFIESVDPDLMNEYVPSVTWNDIGAVTDSYEGSAEMFPTVHRISPVKFTTVSGNDFSTLSEAVELHSDSAEQLSYLVNGLQPFTEYTIAVSAFTIIGEGPPAILLARTSEQVPSSVENINYKNITSSSILLYWDVPINPNGKITHYTVYAMELDTNRAFHMTTSNNSILITGLRKYTDYKMRVAASTTMGESALSEENDIFVRTPEDEPNSPPQNVEVLEVTATEISLRWSPPEKPNGIITHYEVMYNNATNVTLKNTTETNLLLNGLKPHTLYNISVRAFTRLGHGNQSSPLLAIQTAETVPDFPPQNITYRNISSSEIELSFLPPSVPNGIIQSYTIYLREADGTEERIINTTSLSLMITGLKTYTKYVVKVSSSTSKGEGVCSAPLSIMTDEDAPSSPPQLLTVKQLSGVTVKLSWQPPLEPNGIILYYTVYIWNKTSRKSINVTETSLEITDLENNSKYSVYVSASTRFGDGNMKSNMTNFRTSEGAPSDPPRNVWYKNLTSSSIHIFWDPPVKPNGAIQFYSIYLKNDSNTYIQNFTSYDIESDADNETLSTVLSNLAKWSHYTLWLTANTAVGNGNQTSEILQLYTDQDIPDGPIEQLAYQNISSTAVNISWMPPLQPNGIVFYNVSLTMQDVLADSEMWSLVSYDTNMVIDQLEKYTGYILKITPATEKGPSEMHTTSFCIRTEEDVPLAPPENLTIVNYTSNSVKLKWSPSPQPNGIIRRYVFTIFDNSSETTFYQNVSGSHNETNILGLEPFSVYYISVSAFTKVGNGNQISNLVQFTTMESAPDTVENIQCTATSWQAILLQWDPPLKTNGIITHYIIAFGGNSTIISSDNETTHTFGDLLSNTSYHFIIKAATAGGEGKGKTCNASTLSETVPTAPRDIAFSKVQSTSVTLRWIRPAAIFGYFQNYKITTQLRSIHCNNWEAECIEYEKEQYSYLADAFTEETVYDLNKYRWYRFRVSASTNAGYGSSSPWISTQTLPGSPDAPPENVTVVVTSPYNINISWNEPAIITGPTFYLIDISSVDTDDYKASFVKTNDEDKILVITGLRAFTRYSVVVTAFTGDIHAAHTEGKASPSVIVSTFEAVPKDPLNNITFQKIPDEVTKFQVTFMPPSELNGNIQIYQAIVYKEDDPTVFQIHNLSVIDRTNKSITAIIHGLKGGHTYNISVYAINSAGAGPKIQLKITTDIKEPPRPSKKPMPVYDASGTLLVTATTITIHMPVCYYNDDHGPIKKIQILVTEVGVQHDGNVTKWYDAYFKKPRPYFVNEGFPNPPCTEGNEGLSSKEDVYVIGADSTCMTPGSEDKICNGPLKPRKQYLFKFRATNIKGQFTDSDYSDPIKTLGDGLSERAVEIILAVTLCILSVILLVAAIYAFARIRQKQKEGGTYSPRDAEIIDTKFKLDQLITVADLEMKDERFTRLLSYRKSIKPIGKKCFLQHVEELCANNNLKFQEEFSELPKFLPDLASTDADLPWNRSKNRFPNIKPYNNNRVKLMPDASIPGSDYINASYVSGYLCPNEFIATQGPLPGTVGDFWRMVWETRSKTLVMLTQCFEKARIRCHQYWPEDNIPVTVFGDIVITKLVEDIQIDWTVRDLKIERHGDCMMVRQCNFTAWPEHGVPESSASLVHFVKLIRASRAHDSTPIVVHCSAGVGRTGVYIALDHLTQHINDHDFVDIYGLVAELRSERMCMVQNLAQYIFLHQCVLDLLTIKRSSQPVCFVNYSVLQKMDSLDAMEGDVELEWEETTM
nr:phosphatidylinositol phosphatase PTPRQ [Pogona vitticeps]